jgi:hypothetical protein
VNREGWRALRMLAVEKDTTLQAIAVEALNDLLRKYSREGATLTRTMTMIMAEYAGIVGWITSNV